MIATKSPAEERKKIVINDFFVLLFTITSALIATKGLKIGKKRIFNGLMELPSLVENKAKEGALKIKSAVKSKGNSIHNHIHESDHQCSHHSHDNEHHEHHHQHCSEHSPYERLEGFCKKLPKGHEKLKNLIENKVMQNKVLSFKEVCFVTEELAKLEKEQPGKYKISDIIPDPHSHNPLHELVNLSWIGLIPIVSGVVGGVLGDKANHEKLER